MKMLVADDDRDLRELIAFTLTQAGYLVVKAGDGTRRAADVRGRDARTSSCSTSTCRALSGFQVCEAIRAARDVPVMMLTVRGEEEDLVRALGARRRRLPHQAVQPAHAAGARQGAAAARRHGERPRRSRPGAWRSISRSTRVRIGSGAPVRLTKLELRLLQMLLANAGHTVSSDRLLVQVWGHRSSGDRQLLKQLVHRLRQKIEADPAAPQLLQTAAAGYKLVVD